MTLHFQPFILCLRVSAEVSRLVWIAQHEHMIITHVQRRRLLESIYSVDLLLCQVN